MVKHYPGGLFGVSEEQFQRERKEAPAQEERVAQVGLRQQRFAHLRAEARHHPVSSI